MIPPRLAPVLGFSVRDIDEKRLNALKTAFVGEDQDIDFKQARYDFGPKGTFEISKDVAAMANQVGGLIVIGVAEDEQARAAGLTPVKLDDGERVRILATVADRVHPMVPGLEVHMIPAAADDGTGYILICVPHSVSAPHGVRRLAPEAHWACYPLRHGTTTIYLSETQLAARYRDRFELARGQIDRLERLQAMAPREHLINDVTLAVGVVPSLAGSRPLANDDNSVRAYLLGLPQSKRWPILRRLSSDFRIARGRVRSIAHALVAEMHTDGCAWAQATFGHRANSGYWIAELDEMEKIAVELAALAGEFTAWSGAGGDCAIGAWLSRGANPLRVRGVERSFSEHGLVAETTAPIEALSGDVRQLRQAVYPLMRDLEQDLGFEEPETLRSDGSG